MTAIQTGFVVKSLQRRLALPLLAVALLFVAFPELLRSRANLANPAIAEPGARAAFESAKRAKAVLDAGIAALGGLDVLQAIGSISLVERGATIQIGQSMTPDGPLGSDTYEETTIVDTRRNRAYLESKFQYSFGPWQQYTVFDGEHAYRLNHAAKTARPIAASEQRALLERVQRLPQFVLLAALERAHTMRDVGDESIEGRPHRVISAVIGDGELRTLAFDRETHLLTRIATLYADPLFGDTTAETLFTGYANRGGHKLPGGRLVRRAGQVAARADYVTVEINPSTASVADRFAVPADYTLLPAEPPRPRNALRTLAKDVYLIEQIDGANQNVLFVALDDYVLVVEAPEDRTYRGLGETVMRIIRETAPAKPIRYVAPTHHHADHGIGVRPYIAAGVTIITTPGNVAFIRELANLKFELRPDALSLKPRAPIVEAIENKVRVFRDASHIVELHDFGPENHVRETLAVWLPNERILFTGDVIETGYAETARWDGKGKLADILARYKWNVETIATAHSRTRKLSDLRPPS